MFISFVLLAWALAAHAQVTVTVQLSAAEVTAIQFEIDRLKARNQVRGDVTVQVWVDQIIRQRVRPAILAAQAAADRETVRRLGELKGADKAAVEEALNKVPRKNP